MAALLSHISTKNHQTFGSCILAVKPACVVIDPNVRHNISVGRSGVEQAAHSFLIGIFGIISTLSRLFCKDMYILQKRWKAKVYSFPASSAIEGAQTPTLTYSDLSCNMRISGVIPPDIQVNYHLLPGKSGEYSDKSDSSSKPGLKVRHARKRSGRYSFQEPLP